MTATRSVSTASTTFVAANATTTRSMLKDPTDVFVAVVNDDDKKPPLPLEWTRLGKSPTDSFDVVEVEEVKWGMRICICGCQEIADPTTSVLFHDEHGNNQAWLYEKFDTRTDYSIKLLPIRIPSHLKHVKMYREAAREMRCLPEYRNDYVFVEYLIHLMTQEVSCDNMLQSIVIQVTLCSTARLGRSMSEYGWMNKGNSEKSPSEEVGDALSNAFDWPENATDYMNGRNFATIVAWQSCRLVCMKKCLTACGGTYANGCKGMHCQPFSTKEAIFKAGVILIACKVWAKRGVAVCLFNMGGVGSKLFFNQVDDQLFDFATEDKEVIFKYRTFDQMGTHISNYAVWRFIEDGKEADSVQRQIIRRTLSIKKTDIGIGRHFVQCVNRSCDERMISLKTPNLFHALAKSSKAPFVRYDIKLLSSQEWAVIEKDVRSESGSRGNKGAVRSVANQMELETGVMPTLKEAASEQGSRGNEGAVCSFANKMELETGDKPTLKEAAYKYHINLGRKCVGKPKGNAEWAKVVQITGSDEEIQGTEKCADTKYKIISELCHQGIGLLFTTCVTKYIGKWFKYAGESADSSTIIFHANAGMKRWKLTILTAKPTDVEEICDKM
jgi:hypothetical protein